MFLFCAGENSQKQKKKFFPKEKNILWRQDLDEQSWANNLWSSAPKSGQESCPERVLGP